VMSYCQTFDINYRIFRLANLYGVGDKDVSAKKNALLYLINKLAKNEDIGLYYGGYFIRDYIHVSDACRAIHYCLPFATNQIVNIGSGKVHIFIDLIRHAQDKLQSKSNLYALPQDLRLFHNVVQVKDMWLDTTKLWRYGFRPSIKIEDGLDEYIESIKEK
jgi:nucleoside-diphosphate-sugar epimerase